MAMVSGDGERAVRAVADRLGLPEADGGKLPGDKAAYIREMQRAGEAVAMVGDGINDAPAMVQADLAVAVHSGNPLHRETAHLTLMGGDPAQLLDFLELAARTNRKAAQNFAFTFCYNAVAIPVAMAGLLTPLVAVCAMLLSSLSVIGNTLLLVRRA